MNRDTADPTVARRLLPPGSLFPWWVIIIANLPTITVLIVHDSTRLPMLMLPYPGQFLFLGSFFIFAAFFSNAAGRDLELLWDREHGEDGFHISHFYPDWAKPALPRFGIALAVGAAVAWIDSISGVPAAYSTGTGVDQLMHVLGFLELTAVVICAFYIFLWASIIARIRLDPRVRTYPPEQMSPEIRSAAMHTGVALVMFSAYPPLRAYSLSQTGELSLPVAPIAATLLVGIALLFVSLCFLKTRKVGVLLKTILSLPFIAAIAGTYTSGMFLHRYLNPSNHDLGSLAIIIVIFFVVFLVLYSVFRGLVDPQANNLSK